MSLITLPCKAPKPAGAKNGMSWSELVASSLFSFLPTAYRHVFGWDRGKESESGRMRRRMTSEREGNGMWVIVQQLAGQTARRGHVPSRHHVSLLFALLLVKTTHQATHSEH
mmetsp:Transcript_2166/g.7925  ORF Transcript_2166/g.7925 Transcript_2166/m.7925 type:complete len:112 (-) Transcript_2166:12632-12967(-)